MRKILLRNFEFLTRQAAFTDENLERLKRGGGPVIMSGTDKGFP